MEDRAPCGIICSECSIFKAAQDREAAIQLAESWRKSGMTSAQPEWFRCRGCWGDRSVCWSEDCRIYECCVQQRKLPSCAACDDFPCADLTTWAKQSDGHAAALRRLLDS